MKNFPYSRVTVAVLLVVAALVGPGLFGQSRALA
jgi:hypothetical protein